MSGFLGIMVGAVCLGSARASYQASLLFAKTREQFERVYGDARVARLFLASNKLVRRRIALAALGDGEAAVSW